MRFLRPLQDRRFLGRPMSKVPKVAAEGNQGMREIHYLWGRLLRH